MQPERIAELLRPFLGGNELSNADLHSISMYVDILRRWNARINLTAIRGEEEIVTRHFGESIFLARHLFPSRERQCFGPGEPVTLNETAVQAEASARRPTTKDAFPTSLADIGSGAGFPGFPIKLWAPQIHVTLIESQNKKATFLKEMARSLALTNVNVISGRAEEVEQIFDVVTLRAVERFTQILPTAARLVAPEGRLALLIGTQQLPQAKRIDGWTWLPEIVVPESNSRCIAAAARVQNRTDQ